MPKRAAPPTAFKKGTSGNPRGKPPGTKSKATMLLMSLMEAGAKDIAAAVIDAAKRGDIAAARIVLDRLIPPARERPVVLDLPPVTDTNGVAAAQAAILNAAASGAVLPSEAATLAGVVDARRRAIETVELEARLTALEKEKSRG